VEALAGPGTNAYRRFQHLAERAEPQPRPLVDLLSRPHLAVSAVAVVAERPKRGRPQATAAWARRLAAAAAAGLAAVTGRAAAPVELALRAAFSSTCTDRSLGMRWAIVDAKGIVENII